MGDNKVAVLDVRAETTDAECWLCEDCQQYFWVARLADVVGCPLCGDMEVELKNTALVTDIFLAAGEEGGADGI